MGLPAELQTIAASTNTLLDRLGDAMDAGIVQRQRGVLVLHSPPPGSASGFEAVVQLQPAAAAA